MSGFVLVLVDLGFGKVEDLGRVAGDLRLREFLAKLSVVCSSKCLAEYSAGL